MATSYNPKLVINGLVMYLDAGNPASYSGSGTSWVDLSGNNNNCTLINGPTYNQNSLGEIAFDGVNDYGEAANSSSLNSTSITAGVWFKYSANPASPSAMIIGKHTSSGSSNGWYITMGPTGIPGGGCKVGATGYDAASSSALAKNTWHYLTLTTASGSSMKWYVNGLLVTTTVVPTLAANTDVLRIADSIDTFWSIQGCSLSQVQIYNRTLTSAEVLQNFNAHRGRFGV